MLVDDNAFQICYGFHMMVDPEGRKDLFYVLYERWPADKLKNLTVVCYEKYKPWKVSSCGSLGVLCCVLCVVFCAVCAMYCMMCCVLCCVLLCVVYCVYMVRFLSHMVRFLSHMVRFYINVWCVFVKVLCCVLCIVCCRVR
jgi:hypothetical protein